MAIEQGRGLHGSQLDQDAIELIKRHSKRQVIQNEFDPLVNSIRHVTKDAGYHYGCQGAPLHRALRWVQANKVLVLEFRQTVLILDSDNLGRIRFRIQLTFHNFGIAHDVPTEIVPAIWRIVDKAHLLRLHKRLGPTVNGVDCGTIQIDHQNNQLIYPELQIQLCSVTNPDGRLFKLVTHTIQSMLHNFLAAGPNVLLPLTIFTVKGGPHLRLNRFKMR